MDETIDLCASELGTKEYWSTMYIRENYNFKNHGDPGEIWFGEDSEERILRWLDNKNIPKDQHLVDLGCGNGMMIVSLNRRGFVNLTGVDYCEEAVELSKSVTESYDVNGVDFKVVDLVSQVDITGFDIALDKGTYDAISLNPDDALEKRKEYIKNVAKMLKENGLFIITTCNWTENEIISHWNHLFQLYDTIPTPSFQFGGKVGNVVSALVLQKKKI